MKELLVYDPGKRKLVLCGYLDGNVFVRNVNSKRHFMNIVQGYGIQENAFDELKKREIEDILIKEQDTKKEWSSKLSDWEDNGKTGDYGNGKQRFLSTKYMFSSGD